MAGHSKWANIQHRKKAQDKKRGKVFTKLIREITVAARGNGDIDANPRLRLAVDKALASNMTKDTIDRAIKRGAGELDGDSVEEIRYEGYGPGGVAIMVDCMTDNRQRTVADVRHAFSKHGGNLGSDGSVSYLFERQGVIGFDLSREGLDEDTVMEAVLEAGADDVVTEDGWCEVLTTPEDYSDVLKGLREAGLEPDSSDVMMRAATRSAVDNDQAETLIKLLDVLDEHDDVQDVSHNADLPDDFQASDE